MSTSEWQRFQMSGPLYEGDPGPVPVPSVLDTFIAKAGGSPPPQPDRRCDTCQWWDSEGHCHGAPPSTVYENGWGRWPVTAAQDMCAHWTPAP